MKLPLVMVSTARGGGVYACHEYFYSVILV
jgi:hypothetical protein